MADAKAVGDHETTEKEENAFQVDTLQVLFVTNTLFSIFKCFANTPGFKSIFILQEKYSRGVATVAGKTGPLSRPAFQDN